MPPLRVVTLSLAVPAPLVHGVPRIADVVRFLGVEVGRVSGQHRTLLLKVQRVCQPAQVPTPSSLWNKLRMNGRDQDITGNFGVTSSFGNCGGCHIDRGSCGTMNELL